jgi:glucose/arabinose dehydrogenase
LLLNPASSAAPSVFMSVAGTISTDGERGLLGLAAAPDYTTSGNFYLYVTSPVGDIEIRRYTRLNADQGNPNSGDVILTIPHRQFSNHNGGWLGFGPDNLLYLATGDGGGAGDALNNAQNLGSLLGKILRIDVRSDAFPADPNRDYGIPAANPGFAAPEIYAYGLRNPFRASFDGDSLLIGDVGQGAVEEVDLLGPADVGGNYGWPFLEGTRPFRGTVPAGTKPPVAQYEHGTGPLQGRTVTGGYVYRGPVLSLRGLYVFGDFISGNIWSIPAAEFSQGTTLPSSRFTRRNTDFAPDLGALNAIVSFGEDSQRNLFIVDFDGEIFMIQSRQ